MDKFDEIYNSFNDGNGPTDQDLPAVIDAVMGLFEEAA